MAYGRITVPVTTDERAALIKIAELECRDPREQLRYMLRTEAQRRGLIERESVNVNLKEMAVHRSDGHSGDDQETASTPVS